MRKYRITVSDNIITFCASSFLSVATYMIPKFKYATET